ncbi:hypothetical protein BDZ94DRAFT_1264872 [Collybia nuda]|uniref:Alpha-xenorhabdolysin family binary toxin subunit A n=1 Tax=Collybia nuda TaxID=64659 RepID=A0A9P5Y465_9AGAR|nr:hypothetical protein BDZ94DRAFT_1264872 [Collybia nuda]
MKVPIVVPTSPPPPDFNSPQMKILRSFLLEVQQNPPGEAAIARAHGAIANKASESIFREKVSQEIQKLSQTVLEIEQRFARISNLVSAFDSKEAVRDESNKPVRFFPEWKAYHELYVSLLRGSQTTATQLKMKIEDLLSNLIPLVNDSYVTLSDKRKELAGFIEDLDEFQDRSHDKAREFQQLREKIGNFRNNLRKQVGLEAGDVRVQLKSVASQITQVEAELEASSSFFSACWSVLNIPTVLGTASGVGSLVGLIALAPAASLLLVVGGIAALGYGIPHGLAEREKEMQEKRDKILLLELEQESLSGRGKDLREMSGEMIRLRPEFDAVISRLGAMQQIWTMIRSDAVGLQEAMKTLRNARTNAGFNKRVENMEILWKTLAWALDNYALGVAPV